MITFLFRLVILNAIFITPMVLASEGRVVDVDACGEFTIIKFRKQYLVADWRGGESLEINDRVEGDLSSTGLVTLRKTDGSDAEYFISEIVRLWSSEISATDDPRKKKKLIITCTSDFEP